MQAMRREATLADVVGAASFTRDLILIGLTSALTGLAAQLEIRLPLTPVPVTLQPLAVFVCGAALGSRRAALAMLLYLAEGAAGLPVFAGGGAGLAHLAGPTGGYLLGFVPAAFVIGWFAERGWDRTPWRAAVAMTLGGVVLYACGVTQLAGFVGRHAALASGVYPFVLGDLLKVAVAAGSLPILWKLLARARLLPRP
jgi:biotin transport system substrate-specific component